ncbi:MAG: sulfotransferase [Acidimicrobiales bacterium]
MTALRRARPALAQVKWEAKRWAYLDREPSLAATTLLAGSGRSGTTWLGEIIARDHDHRVIFEPFRASRVPAVAHFSHSQYLRPDNRDHRWVEPVERILRGQMRNRWFDHQNKVVFPRRRLVKAIRANNLLKWLCDTFGEVKVVLLVRHPCAVAGSARTLGWQDHVRSLVNQSLLVSDHLQPLKAVIDDAVSPFDRFVVQWCVETMVPLRMLRPEDVCLVFYEDLCRDPVGEATRVLQAIGQEAGDRLDEAVARPSKLARADSAVHQGEDLRSGWTQYVTDAERDRAGELLSAFGLDEIYGTDITPDTAAGHRLLAQPWTIPS